MVSETEITRLLDAVGSGSSEALNELFPLIYEELRNLAAAQMGRERPDHTLQATALVHEVYVRLVGQRSGGWKSRAQFFGVASKAMRRILVDHARQRQAAKRGGARSRLPLDEIVLDFQERGADLQVLDDALTELAKVDSRKAQVVELRFFAGLTAEQVAQVLDISLRTVNRDWELAKAWLYGRVLDGLPPQDRTPSGLR
ncbi:MAG: sigma-70 family RNA polymerase sigma factor [Planctomycetota bacterium]|jgi:RNA polymerase sigma factor (TIGR02999 family)